MPTALQLRRGTTTQHSTFTGLQGEVTVDTTKKTVVVHDGTTAGGTPLAKEADVNARVRYDADQGLSAAQQSTARKNISATPIPAATGLLAFTGTDSSVARQVAAGKGISVTNGDGVSGNPTVVNTGVTSVNGQTGDVTLQAGVTSVNGQTGDVTVSFSIPKGQAFFTSNGSFTVPNGVTKLKATLCGGGGGGVGITVSGSSAHAGYGYSGGNGGAGIVYMTVTPGLVIPVTVGVGGAAGAPKSGGGNAATAGGSTSFGSYATATGGAGGPATTLAGSASFEAGEVPKAASGTFTASGVDLSVNLGSSNYGSRGCAQCRANAESPVGYGIGGGGTYGSGTLTTSVTAYGTAGTSGFVLVEW